MKNVTNDKALAREMQRQIDLEDQTTTSTSASASTSTSTSTSTSACVPYSITNPASTPNKTEGNSPNFSVENGQEADQMPRDKVTEIELQKIQQQNNSNRFVLRGEEKEQMAIQNTKCSSKIQCLIFIPLAILVILAIFILGMEKYGPNGPWSGSLSDLPELFKPDNFTNDELYAWRTDTQGFGLKLEIVNALSEDWHPFFNKAVQDWDDGNPDALTLKTTKSIPDSACWPLAGKLKVCNGNYGPTDWKGINELVYKNGYVTGSTCRMNDYHMESASPGERQYLMCHEIGHGFGLPHSDENFHNRDLRDCLDYTTQPEKNQSPGQRNYELLAQMYGQIKHSSRRIRAKKDPETITSFDDFGFDSRKLSFLNSDISQWKLLSGNKHREIYELDFGNGYQVQAHVLLR